MVRLLHVSDIHFGCANEAAVAAAAEFARSEHFDVVVQSGDITQIGAEPEFVAGAAWLQALERPVVCTPGNHDTPEFDVITRFVDPWRLYRRHIDPVGPRAFRSDSLSVETMNTARGVQARLNWSKGAAREDQAQRLCQRLGESAAGALKVAVCHHPLLEVTGGPMTGRVWGGERAARILACGGADLVLTGHIHMPFAHPLPFGDGRTYAVGASTLSHRERGSPPGFNVVEADETEIHITAMGWTGSRFEAQRSWGFDRRTGEPGCGSVARPQGSGGIAA